MNDNRFRTKSLTQAKTMSDFDTFVAVDKTDDPAAEFLAREKNELGQLEDDFDFPSNPSTDHLLTNSLADLSVTLIITSFVRRN